MVDTDPLRQTLAHYKKLRQEKVEVLNKKLKELEPLIKDVQAYDPMIRQLEHDLGEPSSIKPFALTVPGVDVGADKAAAQPPKDDPREIRPDEFFGLSQTDAARAYLQRVGRAIPFSELVSALQRGGATLGGKNPEKTLQVSLARNPRKEFVWPGKDYIGLSEFYQSRK